jgi:hypothetical protein
MIVVYLYICSSGTDSEEWMIGVIPLRADELGCPISSTSLIYIVYCTCRIPCWEHIESDLIYIPCYQSWWCRGESYRDIYRSRNNNSCIIEWDIAYTYISYYIELGSRSSSAYTNVRTIVKNLRIGESRSAPLGSIASRECSDLGIEFSISGEVSLGLHECSSSELSRVGSCRCRRSSRSTSERGRCKESIWCCSDTSELRCIGRCCCIDPPRTW